MVTKVASNTTANVEYEVTIERGLAIHCTCIGHFYHPEGQCSHMKAKQYEVQQEIARAARFLAVRREVQGMEETWKANRQIFYSEW